MPGDATNAGERLRLGQSVYSWQEGRLRDASGRDVPLRNKSLRMFSALLAERGHVLSKDRLSELVWPDTVATDESIARCIADIRKALCDDDHDIVQTYPKQGYRLHAPADTNEAASGAWFGGSGRAAAMLGLFMALLVLWLVAPKPDFVSSDQVASAAPGIGRADRVAIIPFEGEGEDVGFLASGLSDDLEVHLAEMSGIKTLSLAQTASVATGGKSPLDVAQSLDATYVVLGRLRRNGDQVALSIQLVDGSDGTTVWADRYEGYRDGLIAFRDTLPEALVGAMSVELNARDRQRLLVQDTASPEALAEVMQARRELSQFTYASSLAAEKRLRRAISIDPQYARAYAELASAFAIRLENDWIVLSQADTQKAFFFANRALSLDPDLWFAHYAIGRLHAVAPGGDIEAAVRHLRTAMELQPANDDARAFYAVVTMMSGRVVEARRILESVVATHPHAPFWYFLGLANAHFHLREYEAALDFTSRCLSQMPNSPYCLRTRIAVEARLGRIEDAEWTIGEYVTYGNDPSLDAVMKSAIERDPAMLDHLRKSYELAGLK